MTKIIDKYTNPAHPGSFTGLSGFLNNNKRLNKTQVENELLKTQVYTQHTQPNKNFKRSKTVVPAIDHTWQADLIDVQKIKYQNSHNNYILTVIDCFSKYAWAIPIKTKHATNVQQAFEKIIEGSKRKPLKLHVDGGNEFKGICKKYLEELNIQLYITESEKKAAIVERFNKTLKERMWRMFTFNKNKKYVGYLDDLLISYNNSIHRSIKNKPSKINKKNEQKTFNILYSNNNKIKFKFLNGDYVRVVIDKDMKFKKGYTSNWSDEIFIVALRRPQSPVKYKIKALDGTLMTKSFYEQQLQKVIFEEFPVDTYLVLDEHNNKIQIEKLNSDQQTKIWVDKDTFLNE